MGGGIRNPFSGAGLNQPDSCDQVVRPLNDVEVDGEVTDEIGEGGESGERKVERMNSPGKPSPEEVEQHNLTHLPYRSWCRHCVRGRGKEAPHKAGKTEGGDVPELHMDFCFPGEEEPGQNLTVLVGRMRSTRMTRAAWSQPKLPESS